MIFIRFLPNGKTIRVRAGTSILDASRRARVPIATRCGGKASCLMCKVVVEKHHWQGLAPLTIQEERKLGDLAQAGYRLACQAKCLGDVEVQVPASRLQEVVRRQLAKLRGEALDGEE